MDKRRPPVLDRPLTKTQRNDVSLSFFAFVFAETVAMCMNRATEERGFEQRLHDLGLSVGHRLLEVFLTREKATKRETRIVPLLNFVATTIWKSLFGHAAEVSKGESESEYMLTDRALVLNRFISVPPEMAGFNCGCYAAGIVQGILSSAALPAAVSAHSVDGSRDTVLVVEFEPEAMKQDAGRAG
jgi:hypothetical protein